MKLILLLLFILFTLNDAYAVLSLKNNKGNKYFNKQKYNDALKKYMDAQMDDPQSAALHYNMGNVYYKQKQYEKALEEFNKALNKTELRGKTYYNMGNTYFKLNNFAQAIEHYKKTLEINPNDEDAKYNIEIARKKLQQNMQTQPGGQGRGEEEKDSKQNESGKPNPEESKNKEKKDNSEGQEKADKNKMSKEDAERLLDALNDDEKKTQKKLRKVPVKGRFVEKDW